MRLHTKLIAAIVCICVTAGIAQGQAGHTGAAEYSISFAKAADHVLQVNVRLYPGHEEHVVRLPVWNALYQVRDFAQYIKSISATDYDGHPLPIQQIETSAWRISDADRGVDVTYDIYADNPGPYGTEVSARHAFLNLAEVLLYDDGTQHQEGIGGVVFDDVPGKWVLASAAPVVSDRRYGSNRVLRVDAASYDQLVDSPVELGAFREIGFRDGNADYRIVIDGEAADYDAAMIESSVRRIVHTETGWMKEQPCSTYVFIYHFPRGQGGGGMEHACSTAIDVPAERMKDSSAFDSVTAHEFFHLWNVKRIRPKSLEPVDYGKEQYTRALWFSEGVTSTVQEITLLRAGLITSSEYLRRLSEEIDTLQHMSAHKFQSAEQSSLNAWFEKYPYYRRPERSVSYYNKGEILGAMLDLALRDATDGKKSLRDLFLRMNENYARKGIFFDDSEGVRSAAEAVSGKDFRVFFRDYVAGTVEMPYDDFLRTAGLRVDEQRLSVVDPGFVVTRDFYGGTSVETVTPGSEAERAGLRPGDKIVDLNGKSVVSDAIASLQQGDVLRMRVRTRGRERELKFRAGVKETSRFTIVEVEHPTAEQIKRRAEWLEQPPQNVAGASAEAVR